MHRGPGLFSLLLAAMLPVMGTPEPATSAVEVVAADNAFGFRLLNAVQKTTPGRNVVLSPVSAALNLSMVLNGADGQTRQELLDTLSLPGSDIQSINAANAQLIKMLGTAVPGIALSVADSLWVDARRATLRPGYATQLRASYDAEAIGLDFSQPGAAGQINSWASKETRGKIPKVLDRIDPSDVLL